MENKYHPRRRGSSSALSSILDLPTIARVERARLRYEHEEQRGNDYSPMQNTISSHCPVRRISFQI